MTAPAVEADRTISLGGDIRPPATICAFVYGELFAANLARSLFRDLRIWPDLAIWDMSKDALISRSRSKIATMFLEQGHGDVLVMADHDIGWEPGGLEHLVRVCRELKAVVGGVFPKRGFGIGVPIRFGDFGSYTIPSDRVVECSAVATGFMAIHRDVLVAMAETLPMVRGGYRPFFMQRITDPEADLQDGIKRTLGDRISTFLRSWQVWRRRERAEARELLEEAARLLSPKPSGIYDDLSEDYDFCEKARALGFRVFADLRPELSHWGAHLYTMSDTQWKPLDDGEPVTILVRDLNGPIEVPGAFEPIQLFVDENDQKISADLIRGVPWEPDVVQHIAERLRPDDVVVELGAHIGYETVQLAPKARRYIVAEPMPDTFALLKRNLELHGLAEMVVPFRAAIVGPEQPGPARMFKDTTNTGASHLLGADSGVAGIEVETHTLADLADIYGRIDVLKMDIEGAEYMVLDGAAEALAGCRMIIAEYCEAQLQRVSGKTGAEFLDLLESLGFDTSDIERDKLPKGRAYCNIVVERRESE